jgi:hypothetical protein
VAVLHAEADPLARANAVRDKTQARRARTF